MKRFIICLSVLLISGMMCTSVVYAANSQTESDPDVELSQEIKVLKDELAEIKKDIRELRELIESRLSKNAQKPPRQITGKSGIDGDPSMGSGDADIVLVEFSDFQCPYCAKYTHTTLPLIKKEFIDTGKIRYVYKDFPLAFHKDAQKAAEAAHCAGDEGKYWEMHDKIFENQRSLKSADLLGLSKDIGLNPDAFRRCLDEDRYAAGVREDINAGTLSGVTGTPSFLLGKVNADGEVDGKIIRGAQPYSVFKSSIEDLLK